MTTVTVVPAETHYHVVPGRPRDGVVAGVPTIVAGCPLHVGTVADAGDAPTTRVQAKSAAVATTENMRRDVRRSRLPSFMSVSSGLRPGVV